MVLYYMILFFSFDVRSLFPIVTINSICVSKLSTEQNCFQIETNFQEQQKGTAMTNPVSPFLANIMSKLERDIKKGLKIFFQDLAKVRTTFLLYSIRKSLIDTILFRCLIIFFFYPTNIQFTFHFDNKEQLQFLDVLVKKNCTSKLQFGIFRKDTHLHRYIPNSLHHSRHHKKVCLNYLVHPLLSISLN